MKELGVHDKGIVCTLGPSRHINDVVLAQSVAEPGSAALFMEK